ncbi:MAG TPA: hypothetical protein VFA10_09030 [Ktedonobacteraceae bacterium]|nr:hypothetical protein [Ktedonobacteraceae bacterium]
MQRGRGNPHSPNHRVGRGSIHHARLPLPALWANGRGGRDECCPYRRGDWGMVPCNKVTAALLTKADLTMEAKSGILR